MYSYSKIVTPSYSTLVESAFMQNTSVTKFNWLRIDTIRLCYKCTHNHSQLTPLHCIQKMYSITHRLKILVRPIGRETGNSPRKLMDFLVFVPKMHGSVAPAL